VQTEETKHSEFGGSSAARWMSCPGSVALARTLPPEQGSAYAREGTLAHELAALCLARGNAAEGYVGATLDAGIVPVDMPAHVQLYLDAVADEMAMSDDSELYVEQRFELSLESAEPGEVYGTADAMVYSKKLQRLTVFDFKYGAGVSVSAENNAQMRFYAAGALLAHPDWPIGAVDMVIVQPRAFDVANNGAVRGASVTPLDLLDFAAELDRAVAAAKQPDAPFAAGSWCKFCPAAAVCPIAEAQFIEAAKLNLPDIASVSAKNLPKPADLDLERLGKTLHALKVLEGWAEQVREFAFGLAQSGVAIPGYKLVASQARRKWIRDDTEIAAYLELTYGFDIDTVFPRKIATITEVERLIAAKVKDKEARKEATDLLSLNYTIKESSGVTLVPVSDKREAVNAMQEACSSVQV